MTIGIEHVNDYPLIRFEIRHKFESYLLIRFEIRFGRKFLIRRSLLYITALLFMPTVDESELLDVQQMVLKYTQFPQFNMQ